MHREPFDTGARSSPSSLVTTPFSMVATAGHIWMQPWQEV